jgi:hypothetical protein
MGEDEKIKKQLEKLQHEHHVLDQKIADLTEQAVFDQLLVQRLKRKKLQLKDQISGLQSYLCDDIIA